MDKKKNSFPACPEQTPLRLCVRCQLKTDEPGAIAVALEVLSLKQQKGLLTLGVWRRKFSYIHQDFGLSASCKGRKVCPADTRTDIPPVCVLAARTDFICSRRWLLEPKFMDLCSCGFTEPALMQVLQQREALATTSLLNAEVGPPLTYPGETPCRLLEIILLGMF